jgi:tryptophan halogenase
MNPNAIKKIVIVGGGTAGWMAAAALAKKFSACNIQIVLVESEAIGTVGVGESTIPHIRHFNQFLEIDENVFIAETKATFKLGIAFKNWGVQGSDYIHPFGPLGHDISGVEFHHYWLRMQREGSVFSLDNYSVAAMAARAGKFQHPSLDRENLLSNYSYAFHFDAALYAKYLRNYSEVRGVVRQEGVVVETKLDSVTGFIQSIVLDSGVVVDGDLFIDCTGFKGLLIDKALHAEFEDWSHWLVCDKAIAVPCESSEKMLTPYTQAIAHKAGWQWRIPLQHRTGNGHVYASDYMSEDEATAILLNNLDGATLAEPKSFTFKAGKRKQNWKKNCVAIGLASGFLEPLESTSIYLIQVGIQKLIEFFPDKSFFEANTAEFNYQVDAEYTRIRDFIIMHYKETRRDDSEFWVRCKNMSVPAALQQRQDLFGQTGFVDREQYGVYESVCIGQGLLPKHYDFKINQYSSENIMKYLQNIRMDINAAVQQMPSAKQYIEKMVAANSVMAQEGQR